MMKPRILKESSTEAQYKSIKTMGKRGYRIAGFDCQGLVMTRMSGKWLLKVRVLRSGTIQRYKITEPNGYEKQVYS